MTASRQETIRYHREFFASHELYENGTWLAKPDHEVLDLVPILKSKSNLEILDLGAASVAMRSP